MEQPMHQSQMTMPQHHQQTTAIHPNMHMSAAAAAAAAGLPPSGAATGPAGAGHQTGGHPSHHPFLSSPALASPVGSTNNATHPNNPPLAANAPCSTLFVANLGQFVSEHELKEVFSRGAGMESRHDLLGKKIEREMQPQHQHQQQHHHQQHQQFLMTTPT